MNLHYLTPNKKIGMLAPVPQIDSPLILEFSDGMRDAFHVRDLIPTTAPLTAIAGSNFLKRKRHRTKKVKRETIEKQLQLLALLKEQTKPIKLKDAEAILGFRCVYVMSRQREYDSVLSLEELGLVERRRAEKTWITWIITKKGRDNGEKVIKSQFLNYDNNDDKILRIIGSVELTPMRPKKIIPKKINSKRDPIGKGLKFLKILRQQTEALQACEFERLLGFRIQKKLVTFQELGLITGIKFSSRSYLWEVTPKGREYGEQLIKEYYSKRKARPRKG